MGTKQLRNLAKAEVELFDVIQELEFTAMQDATIRRIGWNELARSLDGLYLIHSRIKEELKFVGMIFTENGWEKRKVS